MTKIFLCLVVVLAVSGCGIRGNLQPPPSFTDQR
jgi:predicted small lipoprotein YifL